MVLLQTSERNIDGVGAIELVPCTALPAPLLFSAVKQLSSSTTKAAGGSDVCCKLFQRQSSAANDFDAF